MYTNLNTSCNLFKKVEDGYFCYILKILSRYRLESTYSFMSFGNEIFYEPSTSLGSLGCELSYILTINDSLAGCMKYCFEFLFDIFKLFQ